MTTPATHSAAGTRPVREPLFTPAFIGLAAADLAYFTAVGTSILALPLYVTGPVGAGTAGAGLAFGAFAITALILRPVAGRLADTIGRRPLLVCGALSCAVSMVATAHVESLALVVGIRLLAGVGEAAFFVAGFAALVDIAPANRLGEALSYNSLGLYLGITGGPLLGGLLIAVGGFTAAWYGAAVLAMIAAAVVLTIGETRDPAAGGAERPPLIHRGAVAPTVGLLASIIAMGGFLAFAALHAEELRMAATGVPLATYGAVVVVCRIAFARVPDRLPPLALGTAALCLIAAGLVVMATTSTAVGLVLGAVVLALGVTFSTPAFFAAVFATARPSERGAASATASIALDLGLGAGPILLGLVASSSSIPTALVVAAAVALAGAGWTANLYRGAARVRAAAAAA